MEPVLFEKLDHIKLSHSVFRVTTFFPFYFTKSTQNILLQYAQDLDENLKHYTPNYSQILTMIIDHMM